MLLILRPLLRAATLVCAPPASAVDPQPTNDDRAQPDPAPIGYAVLNVSRERVESGTTCDVGLHVHDELVDNLQPGASLAPNLQPGAVGVRPASNDPGDACRSGMTILTGQTLTLRTGEIRNLRIALDTGGFYLASVADEYWEITIYSGAFAIAQGTKMALRHRVHGGCLAGREYVY